jgi:hypothetical protein
LLELVRAEARQHVLDRALRVGPAAFQLEQRSMPQHRERVPEAQHRIGMLRAQRVAHGADGQAGLLDQRMRALLLRAVDRQLCALAQRVRFIGHAWRALDCVRLHLGLRHRARLRRFAWRACLRRRARHQHARAREKPTHEEASRHHHRPHHARCPARYRVS